ncbi:NACHT, LRR and PYD domains-containing protein 12-like [Aegotheles albertisi]
MGVHSSRSCAPSSSNPQGTVREQLLRTLEDLSELDFKKFRDALAHGDLQGRSCIPWGRLENANWMDVKNLMVDFYGAEAALDVAITILEKIHLHRAATQLRESREKGACQQDYKEAIRHAYSRIKDQNARLGDAVSLDARYSKLVIVSKHRDKEQREHEIMAVGWRHVEILRKQAGSSIAVGDLFKPSRDGWTPKEVVLLGAAGVGKTMTARKIMLDWACNKMFAEFDYVFYIHCREGNLLTSRASMEDLIARCCPCSTPPLAEVLRRPERVLFVIDGFDELRFTFDQPESELCSQPREQRPVEITLSSLFRRKLLPKSSLLVTTRPTALQKLGRCLQCERYAEILGFSMAERKEYFHRFFENTEQAAAAFQLVRGNETLFTMCLVPIVCWIICTVMKQQLSRPGGLARSPRTTTGIYILYLSSLLRSLSDQLRRDMPTVLRRLCCLAANGVWNQKVLFEENEVQEYELDQQEALPLLLNEHLFQNKHSCVSTFSFIHLSFQEFFAALFYLLEDDGEGQDPPASPTRDVKVLLESYGNSRNHFMLTVRFLFGLLNEEYRRELEEETGCKIAPRIKQELLDWLQNSQKMQKTVVIRELEVCHCLYELQDEQLVATALEPFTGVELQDLILSHFDLMVLCFSLKHLPSLESLDLENCIFLWDQVGPQLSKQDGRDNLNAEEKLSPIQLLCGALEESGCELKRLRELIATLGTIPSLEQLDLSRNSFKDGSVRELCEALSGPSCNVQKLWLSRCQLKKESCRALAKVLCSSHSLKELDLGHNELGDNGVRRLSEGLRDPACQLQTLRLSWCRLKKASCRALAEVLCSSHSLRELDLGHNELGDDGVWWLNEGLRDPTCQLQTLSHRLKELDLGHNELGDNGVQRLSEGLRDPTCQLQTLRLSWCRLKKESCEALAEVLCSSHSLRELDLGDNPLKDEGVRQLSEGLRDPTCQLQTLSLRKCQLTSACCEDLCAMLSTNRTLEHLDLSENNLGDGDMQLLCKIHPTCSLQWLRPQKSGLNEEMLLKMAALTYLT